jgi:hypothetical protein
MFKKIVSLFTLAVFLFFNMSCYKTVMVDVKKVDKLRGRNVKITKVYTKSGEIIEFVKGQSRVLDDRIEGKSYIAGEEQELNVSEIEKIKRGKWGTITQILPKKGWEFDVRSARIEGDRVFFKRLKLASVSIPLEDVRVVIVEKFSPVKTLFATILTAASVIVVTVGGLILYLIITEPESCPFIYSFDGEEYVLDAEPYGGSICKALERTEWCGLEYLREVNGRYRILVTNEMDETQYTDEIKLVVVDHPGGTKVVPDIFGGVHAVSNPVIPSLAYDGKGEDISHYVSEKDWLFWTSDTDGRNPQKKEDLRDELIFEFPKPVNADKGRLIFNGCNTLFGSYALKLFLDLYGNKVQDWYKEMNSFGPAFFRTWNLREEVHTLWVRVETETGWKTKAMLLGGGPFVSEDKLYTLDLSDVPGDTLKIKLTPPAAFWMINYLAVDYGENVPVTVREIAASEAKDHRGQDVSKILAKNDNNFLIMPEIGDSAELVFEAPPRVEGMERSVILKAGGYYDIHLQEKGEPQFDILEKFNSTPGFVVRYFLEKYLQLKDDMKKKHRKYE